MVGATIPCKGKDRIVVVGGGISGMTAALEAAEVGARVLLVERSASLGGRVARMARYYPKLCPPACGLEINCRRLRENPRIEVLTLAEVESVSGRAGAYEIAVRQSPRYVNENCTACGECAGVCTLSLPDEFDYRMSQRRAAYLPFPMAYPMRYVLDPLVLATDDARRCREACRYGAIDLEMRPRTMAFEAAAIVIATGWNPYNAHRLEDLGGGRFPNVITNVMMERLASPDGPTQGKVVRPSDGAEVRSVVFVQCAGSRDENHLPYCSGVCCLASMKQALYVLEQVPAAKVLIFYIDIRAPGRLEDFYARLERDSRVEFIKGKVARISEEPGRRDPVVEVENILSGEKIRARTDLVVLATGMVPATAAERLPMDIAYDEFGFVISNGSQKGIYAAGCARRPVDVSSSLQDATGAALKAIQCLSRR